MRTPYFSQRDTCANFSERAVYLIIPAENVSEPDTKILIVNGSGAFVNFPGIENPGFIAQYIRSGSLAPFSRFVTAFEDFKDGKALVLWEAQPDGWYWADEGGFGAESDYEITLYSYLDEGGKFLAPFRIYRIGRVDFFGTDLEDTAAKEYARRQARDREIAESGDVNKAFILISSHIDGFRSALNDIVNRRINILRRDFKRLGKVVRRTHGDVSYRLVLAALHYAADGFFKSSVAADADDNVVIRAHFLDNGVGVSVFFG